MKKKKLGDKVSKRLNAAVLVSSIKKELGYKTMARPEAAWLDTGSPRLNRVLGSEEYGIRYGKIIVICGDWSSGKTLLGNKLCGLAQADGAEVGYGDIENSVDPPFAKKMSGLDFGKELGPGLYENVALFQPEVGIFGKTKKQPSLKVRLETAEELFNLMEKWMLKSYELNPKGKRVLLIDSTTAVSPEEELAKDVDEQNMRTKMSLPMFLNMLLKRWQHVALNTNTLVILISQIRIDPMAMFGNPERLPGGKGLHFYPAVIVQSKRARKGGTILDSNGDVIGLRSILTNLKNKTGWGSVERKKCGMKAYFTKNKWKFLPAKVMDKV